jgi:hypothetical protein
MWYRFWVFVHISGALGFLAVHGVSAGVAFRLRREHEPDRVRALLALSAATRPWMYASLSVLLAGGIVAGSLGSWWGDSWIWEAVVLLTLLVVGAVPLAVPYYRRVRKLAAGPGSEDLARVLQSPRPIVIAVVESVGLLLIVYLMVLKPG